MHAVYLCMYRYLCTYLGAFARGGLHNMLAQLNTIAFVPTKYMYVTSTPNTYSHMANIGGRGKRKKKQKQNSSL